MRSTLCRAIGGCWLLFCLAFPASGGAAVRVYTIAVGNNASPRAQDDAPRLEPLRYADDDAAALYEFMRPLAEQATLLSVLDQPSQRRFATAAKAARPPTLSELQVVLTDYTKRMQNDRKQGHSPHLVFFFSGHGFRVASGHIQLALLDGGITRKWLEERLLSALPARFVHLLVDACHAEALVRSRGGQPSDLSAQVVDISADQARQWFEHDALRRFPQLGLVIATSATQQAHEWDIYAHGVFTHQVLSGLRGAADVNGDKRVEYSELHAFLGAANRAIEDPRAQLQVVVRAPSLNQRIPLIDLAAPCKGCGWIVGATSALGHFYLDGPTGRRLLDGHIEAGHRMRFIVPAQTTMHLHSAKGQATVRVAQGESLQLAQIQLSSVDTRTKGALASALQRGLFVTPYGPHYYRGFVDRAGDLSVAFPTAVETAPAPTGPSTLPAWIAFGTSGALLVAAGVFGGLALAARDDWHDTDLQRPAQEARERYDAFQIAFFATAGAAAIAAGVGLWLYPWSRPTKPTRHAFTLVPQTSGVAAAWQGVW